MVPNLRVFVPNTPPRLSPDRRIRVFDRIAWFYGLLFRVQRIRFRRTFQTPLRRLGLPERGRILDIGCGTGAYVSVMAEMGYEVWAVDASPRMVATARRLLRRAGLADQAARVSPGDPLEGLGFPDRHFDLVLAAHVLHGLVPAQRRKLYGEAARVSRGMVLFHDYADRQLPGPGLVTRVLEALEHSDYRRFRRNGLEEMRACFASAEILPSAPGSAWYLCRLSS